jgi:hypothetical protein
VLLSADHGQVDVHPGRVDYLDVLWPELSTYLTQRAAGSGRDVFLHVAPDTADHVAANLQERLGARALVCRAHTLFHRSAHAWPRAWPRSPCCPPTAARPG